MHPILRMEVLFLNFVTTRVLDYCSVAYIIDLVLMGYSV